MIREENYRNLTDEEVCKMFDNVGCTVLENIHLGIEAMCSDDDKDKICFQNDIVNRFERSRPDNRLLIKRNSDDVLFYTFFEGKARKDGDGIVTTFEPVQAAWNKIFSSFDNRLVYGVEGAGIFPACYIPFNDFWLPSKYNNPTPYMQEYQSKMVPWLQKYFNIPEPKIADFSGGSNDGYVHFDYDVIFRRCAETNFFDLNYQLYKDQSMKKEADDFQESLF